MEVATSLLPGQPLACDEATPAAVSKDNPASTDSSVTRAALGTLQLYSPLTQVSLHPRAASARSVAGVLNNIVRPACCFCGSHAAPNA